MSTMMVHVLLDTDKIDALLKNALEDFEAGKFGSAEEAKAIVRDMVTKNINEFVLIEAIKTPVMFDTSGISEERTKKIRDLVKEHRAKHFEEKQLKNSQTT